ncbi:MAG: hypothetical protein HXY18_12635 [Bryobacteraceae bacterium]|nr:hypothetical protein [Bryobacteraceae bacterium]
MDQQKLDLVEFSSGIPAQTGAGPAEVVRGQNFNGCSFGPFLYGVPHNPFRHAVSPSLACAANAPKHAAFGHACRHKPGIDTALDPVRNGYGSNMAALANQIDDGPVILPALEMSNFQFRRLFPAQPATQQCPEQRSIPFAFERSRVRYLPERSCLFVYQPVAKANSEVLRPSDSADSGSQIRTQQAGIGSFVREPPDGCEPAVNPSRRKLTRFQAHSVAGNDGPVERQPGFGAVPGDELVYRAPVTSLRFL